MKGEERRVIKGRERKGFSGDEYALYPYMNFSKNTFKK